MEVLLIVVTLISLALAVTMSLVAWRLIREDRNRKAARIDALEAMAFEARPSAVARFGDAAGSSPAFASPAPAFATSGSTFAVAVAHPFEPSTDDSRTESNSWDLALRSESDPDQFARSADDGQDESGSLLFDQRPTPSLAVRRWMAAAAVVLLVVAFGVIVSALRSPEIRAAVAATRAEGAQPTIVGPHPLELLSLRHSTGADGAFVVTGLVQNPLDGQPLDHVSAIVYLFDSQGRFLATGRASLDPAASHPGEEASFSVSVPNATGVTRYRVGFRKDDGGVVGHVDRRGQVPDGTTGDAVEAATPRPITSGRPGADSTLAAA